MAHSCNSFTLQSNKKKNHKFAASGSGTQVAELVLQGEAAAMVKLAQFDRGIFTQLLGL